jgi:hybrid cluster-associated redox disulfide protein
MSATITKDMSIQDIVSKYPDAVDVFSHHGLHCVGCFAATYESLEQGASAHGLDTDALLKDLNDTISD